MQYYSPIRWKSSICAASAFDNRVLFFRLSFSIIDHFETFYKTVTNLYHRPDFCEISFFGFRFKKKKKRKRTNSQKIALFASRNTVRILLLLSYKYVSTELFFLATLFLFTKAFPRASHKAVCFRPFLQTLPHSANVTIDPERHQSAICAMQHKRISRILADTKLQVAPTSA